MAINKNIRMLIVNDADEATITQSTGTAVATLPLSNVQLYSNSRVFRTTDINQVVLALTWTEPKVLSGVSLWRHTLSIAGTWRVEVFADIAMTQLLKDSTTLQAVKQKALGEIDWIIDPLVSAVDDNKYQGSDFWFDDVAAQAVRITLIDPTNINGFFDVTRLYVGRALQPNINFSYGHTFGWASKAEKKRTAGGTAFAKKRARPRSLSFDLKWLNEFDRPHFVNAINLTGDDTDWYVSMFPGTGGQKERQYAMACMFTALPDVTADFNNNYQMPYTLEEA